MLDRFFCTSYAMLVVDDSTETVDLLQNAFSRSENSYFANMQCSACSCKKIPNILAASGLFESEDCSHGNGLLGSNGLQSLLEGKFPIYRYGVLLSQLICQNSDRLRN